MKYFCTYFDINYMPQGMTLYESLCRLELDFNLFIVCLDNKTYEVLKDIDFPQITPVKISDIESFDLEFAKCKENRSLIEYYFTLSPVMPLYLFHSFPEIDILAYMDADLLFFSSPQPLYDELGDNSILIIEHRFPNKIKWRQKYGRFNVQFQLYRRDKVGLECLEFWRKQCIEWCYDKLDGERFADQKYLDKWPELFQGVVVSQIDAAGVAPWNWYNYNIRLDDGTLKINEAKLIFFHFQGFKILNRFILVHNLGHYGAKMPRKLLNSLYLRYLHEIVKMKNKINTLCDFSNLSVRTKHNRAGASYIRTIASGIFHRAIMFMNEKL